ncbi:lamina-associated polypeptide 2-like [Xenopus tropicalis]|uniref:Lamina-associated polypeptide 2-like n=1 Tax=Xenopus tropicalis TaxID=8364 RepID=A0A8J1IM99_XENTR|nr:lamina-associated polypeptide 2-like [Xenopus tropicalis]
MKETVQLNTEPPLEGSDTVVHEISSDNASSSEDEETGEEISVFDWRHLNPLIKAVRRTLNLEDADQPSTSLLFSRKKKTVFPVHNEVQELMKAEWSKISRRIPVERKIEKLFPFADEVQEIWTTPPSVDAPVARLSRKTALPIDDIFALKHPMDRMETELKKCYMSAGAACKPAVALVSVTKALSLWTESLEQAVKEKTPREKILEHLEDFRVASNFCLEAALHLVQLSTRAMSFGVAACRALWVRSWFADTASKNSLCKMPYEGKRLFGKALDDIISKSTGGKSTFLPQTRRFRESTKKQSDTFFRRRNDARSYRPGREYRTSTWRSGQNTYFKSPRVKQTRSPKSTAKTQ